MSILALTIGAMVVNNIVLTQFLGICPFLGVSKKLDTAIGMGAAVLFVMVLSTGATWMIQNAFLKDMQFMQTVVFILLIAGLVQLVETILKKISPALYQALGIYLPLITTNCTILGVAISVGKKGLGLGESITYATFSSLGFLLALVIFAGIRERLEMSDLPPALKGAPVSLITAGLLALAFGGFAGMV